MCNGSCANCNGCGHNSADSVATIVEFVAENMLNSTIYNDDCDDDYYSFGFFGNVYTVSELLRCIIEINSTVFDNDKNLNLMSIELDSMYGEDSLFYLTIQHNGDVYVQNALVNSDKVVIYENDMLYIRSGSEYEEKILDASSYHDFEVLYYDFDDDVKEEEEEINLDFNGIIYGSDEDDDYAKGFEFTYEPDDVKLTFKSGNDYPIIYMISLSEKVFDCYKKWTNDYFSNEED